MPITVEGLTPLVQVFDMPTSVKFYRDVIGFEVVMQSSAGDDFDWCFLRLNGAGLMLNTAYEKETRPPSTDPLRIAAHEDTTLYFRSDPDAAYEHLIAQGIKVNPPTVAPYGMKQLYLKDPDGYVICFQSPAGDEE
jgi:catechol 2,3-dioxygenase-like lactoylglutathione lyase family enzyme